MTLKALFLDYKELYTKYASTVLRRCKIWLLFFFCSSIFFVVLYKRVNPPLTPLMVIRTLQQTFNRQKPILDKQWVPIEDISPYMIYAVMAAEDNKFVTHFGFDITALQTAIEYDFSHAGSLLWWSTITQQTAKNVFLRPSQDILRKWLEAYFTLLMESIWGKQRIMEVYLNEIEFGNGIYGVDAAAHYYFNTTAKKLTSYQASLLAAILPNPRYYQSHLYDFRLQKRKNAISSGINRMKSNSQNRTFVRAIK